jgi:hypothetical protein
VTVVILGDRSKFKGAAKEKGSTYSARGIEEIAFDTKW